MNGNINLTSIKYLSSLPPYGYWEQLNSLSYSNGLLALGYGMNNRLSFICLFNLDKLTDPLLMIGGYYMKSFDGQF